MFADDRAPGGEQTAEMRRILRKVLAHEELSDIEVEFLHTVRIMALAHFLDAR